MNYPALARYRDDSTRVFRDDVLANLGRTGRVLIDARTPEEYEGTRPKPGEGFDFGAERYRHIPGARILHARDLMNPTDFTVKPAAELEELFRAVGAAPDQAADVVAYCRPSHRPDSLRFIAR